MEPQGYVDLYENKEEMENYVYKHFMYTYIQQILQIINI